MQDVKTDHTNADLPIACTLTADEQAAWGVGMGRTVFEGYDEVRELPDGYALRYPGDARWARTLTDFIVHERACCAFFTFALTFEPNHGRIWLHLSGSAEIKAFAAAMIGRER